MEHVIHGRDPTRRQIQLLLGQAKDSSWARGFLGFRVDQVPQCNRVSPSRFLGFPDVILQEMEQIMLILLVIMGDFSGS